jgi:D-beta-D-heptose 7-phosphate kinase/D-beta-D-heptose 1-phosphate adenosyltransferase
MKFEIPSLENTRILVIGDVMLDRYWQGATDRISPEAPVPIVHVHEVKECAGGAANVTLNLKALGCQVSLLALVGNDMAADTLEHQLTLQGIDCRFKRLTNAPTITKLRIVSHSQQLIRADFEHKFESDTAALLIPDYQELLTQVDAIILSDYGKGTLQAAQELISLAHAANIPVLVDPKGKDFSIYRNATVITPNLKEFQTIVGPCQNLAELETKGLALMQAHHFAALLITRGEQGMSLLRAGQAPLHLPALAQEVFDVTGAGDTVIAVFAAIYAAKQDFAMATELANTAAGIVVRKLGAATASLAELRRACRKIHGSELGVLNEEILLEIVADARMHGERIVMTNGCFDILHSGHVAYLEKAKALGDRLIVAVNSDESVAQLKGPRRPINPLSARMAVLAALRSVDWVVPFSEQTPGRLISRVLPDLLVKGGDYQVHEIAGGQQVLAHGGMVKILNFEAGFSTSAIIEKARGEII